MNSVQAYVHEGQSRPAPPAGPLRVDVSALAGSPITCGSLVFRHRGHLRVTAIVKATFRLVPDGSAAVTRPEPIRSQEEHHGDDPAGSLRSGGDLAPHRPRADVVFVGHAHAIGGPASASSARLAVFRERALVDKTIHVYCDWSDGDAAGPAAPRPFERMPLVYERAYASPDDHSHIANPVGTPRPNLFDPRDPKRPIGFGPISSAWPIRARLLGEADRRALDAPLPELAEAFDWRYFQVAPPDQQVDALHGDEWIVLDGLHPTRPRVQTRLPSATPVARVHHHGSGAGEPLPLTLDTLAIDGDRQSFSLVWRGSVAVREGEAAPTSLQILVALRLPERRAARAPAPKTAVLSMPDHLRANAAPATPFDAANDGTASSRAARVVEASRSSSADLALPGAPWSSTPAPPTPDAGGLAGTMCVSSGLGETRGVGQISPFVAPFPVAGPGASRPLSADLALPGAPWAAAPASHAPQIGDTGEGTLCIMAPAEMQALLAKGRPSEPPPSIAPPAAPPPIAPAEMRALLDKGRPSEPAPREVRRASPPALPLKGSIYGKPRRKKG